MPLKIAPVKVLAVHTLLERIESFSRKCYQTFLCPMAHW